MADLPKTIKDFNAYIDGVGWAGKVKEATLPTIELSTEDVEAGGLLSNVEVWNHQLEKMELEITFNEFSADLFGHLAKTDLPMTLRGVLANRDGTEPLVYSCRGLFKSLDGGSLQRSGDKPLKVKASLTYVKVTIADRDIIEIDVLQPLFVRDGTDLLADHRAALGL